jgi:hypothetical protein
VPSARRPGGRRPAGERQRGAGSRRRAAEPPRGGRPPRGGPAGPPPPASPFVPGMAPECLVCPFGLLFYTLRTARPEAMEHLLAAGHELFLALRALVEAAGERWEQAQTLQRIPVR